MAHGGLLMVYSDTLTNFGKISSEKEQELMQIQSLQIHGEDQQEEEALDGGSVNIFTNYVINAGNLTAKRWRRWKCRKMPK